MSTFATIILTTCQTQTHALFSVTGAFQFVIRIWLFSENVGHLIWRVTFLNQNAQPKMRHPALYEHVRQLRQGRECWHRHIASLYSNNRFWTGSYQSKIWTLHPYCFPSRHWCCNSMHCCRWLILCYDFTCMAVGTSQSSWSSFQTWSWHSAHIVDFWPERSSKWRQIICISHGYGVTVLVISFSPLANCHTL